LKRKTFLIISTIVLLLLILTMTRAKIRLNQNDYQIPNGIIAPSGGGNFSNSTGISLNATMGQCFVGKTNNSEGDLLINGRHYPLAPLSTNAGAVLY